MNWLELNNENQLSEIEALSFKHPVAIFKHSIRCSISSFVKRAFEQEWAVLQNNFPVFLLDLIAHRSVSNAVAAKFGVVHQSPQLIVLRNGKAVYAESHDNISAVDAIASSLEVH